MGAERIYTIQAKVKLINGEEQDAVMSVDHPLCYYGVPVFVLPDDQNENIHRGVIDWLRIVSYKVNWIPLRKELGLTQSAMASRLAVPVRTYQGWENKHFGPPLAQLMPLFETLHRKEC